MNEQKKKNSYFFTCAFTWWIMHYILGPFDKVEVKLEDKLLDHMEDFDTEAEESSEWLLQQCRLGGVNFWKNGKANPIHECMFDYELEIIRWVNQVVTAAREDQEIDQYARMYCLLLGYMQHILKASDKQLGALQIQELAENYSEGKQLIDKMNGWIQQDIDKCIKEFSIGNNTAAHDENALQLYKSLEEKWHEKINEAVEKYSIPIQ